jgi:hypothetical protein
MKELIKVRCLMDFVKGGVGENIRGFKGDILDVSPELAEYLAERNMVEVLFEENKDNQE